MSGGSQVWWTHRVGKKTFWPCPLLQLVISWEGEIWISTCSHRGCVIHWGTSSFCSFVGIHSNSPSDNRASREVTLTLRLGSRQLQLGHQKSRMARQGKAIVHQTLSCQQRVVCKNLWYRQLWSYLSFGYPSSANQRCWGFFSCQLPCYCHI